MVSNGKALQIGQRRIAGAEIVEREPGAKLADPLQHLRGVLGIFHHHGFGELELERAARHHRARQHAAQILNEIVAQQLPRRDVDAGEQRIAQPQGALPGAELLRGALQHEQAELDDQPGLLGDGDELGGRHAAELWMVPARQRLEAGDRAVFEPHDRLVEDGDFFALDGAAQVRLQGQPVGLARPHRRLEHLDAVAAAALGVIHRKLGVFEDLLAALRLVVAERHADRAGDEDFALVEGDRRAQGAADGLRHGGDFFGAALRQQDQRELIAGEAGERVLRLDHPAQPSRQREQDRVADRHADGIVDLLEAVEIDHHDGRLHRRFGLGKAEHGVEAVEEQLAVGQPGEVVVHRVVQQTLLGGLELGDVGQACRPGGSPRRRSRPPAAPAWRTTENGRRRCACGNPG